MFNVTVEILYSNRIPWINQELRTDMSKRDHMYSESIKHPTPENIEKCKNIKNQVISKRRKAERDYYRDQFELHDKDFKKSWNIIKTIIGREEKTSLVKCIDFVIDNNIIRDTYDIANSFNDLFSKCGSVTSYYI